MSLSLLKSANQIPLTPLIALIGPEGFVRRKLREHLTQRALGTALKEMNFSEFQAGEDELARAIDACRDYPCFAEKRVVWLRDVAKLRKKETREFLSYLENPQPTTIFILEDEKLDGRLDWVKVVKKQAQWIDISEANREEALQWVKHCFKKEAKNIREEVAERLVAWVGTSLEALQLTTRQLCLYVGDLSEVTLQDIEKVLVKVSEENIFEVIDELFAGNIARLHRSLAALLQSGEAPLKILALVYRHLAVLLTLKYSTSPSTSDLLRMSPMIRRKYELQAKKYQMQLNLSLLAPVVKADLDLKSSSLNKILILKCCVEKIAALLGYSSNQT